MLTTLIDLGKYNTPGPAQNAHNTSIRHTLDLGKYNIPGPAQNAHNTPTRHTYRPR